MCTKSRTKLPLLNIALFSTVTASQDLVQDRVRGKENATVPARGSEIEIERGTETGTERVGGALGRRPRLPRITTGSIANMLSISTERREKNVLTNVFKKINIII